MACLPEGYSLPESCAVRKFFNWRVFYNITSLGHQQPTPHYKHAQSIGIQDERNQQRTSALRNCGVRLHVHRVHDHRDRGHLQLGQHNPSSGRSHTPGTFQLGGRETSIQACVRTYTYKPGQSGTIRRNYLLWAKSWHGNQRGSRYNQHTAHHQQTWQ